MTATAEKKVISGMMPTVTGPRLTDALSRLPAKTRRLSAEKPSSRPFWMTIDRPKVTSSGGRISLPSVRLSRKYCSAQPMANISGTAISGRDERVEPERRHQHQDQEGGEHDQIAMREIDQPHDAEDEAQARRKQRVEAAEQHALENGIKPVHDVSAPK